VAPAFSKSNGKTTGLGRIHPHLGVVDSEVIRPIAVGVGLPPVEDCRAVHRVALDDVHGGHVVIRLPCWSRCRWPA